MNRQSNAPNPYQPPATRSEFIDPQPQRLETPQEVGVFREALYFGGLAALVFGLTMALLVVAAQF
ncbi:MAG: hypothetical protein WBD20_23355 [Pirellulaceae bacterium]